MKLDRNTCPHEIAHGKYALIHLRKLNASEIRYLRAATDPMISGAQPTFAQLRVPADAISLGMEARGQTPFFVIKYGDIFAAPALKAYLAAVEAEAARLHASSDEAEERRAMELEEYASEIRGELEAAVRLGTKIPD